MSRRLADLPPSMARALIDLGEEHLPGALRYLLGREATPDDLKQLHATAVIDEWADVR